MEAESALQTCCGHTYCSDCFENLCLAPAIGNEDKIIECQGDSGECRHAFSLTELQWHLTSAVFEDILQMALDDYIRRRPRELRSCPTVDCEHIYRLSDEPKAKQCPMCAYTPCHDCGNFAHEAMTCAQYKDWITDSDETFVQYKKDVDLRDCPQCKSIIFKDDGCGHIHCTRCAIHICWKCMETSDDSGLCYSHVWEAHGGS